MFGQVGKLRNKDGSKYELDLVKLLQRILNESFGFEILQCDVKKIQIKLEFFEERTENINIKDIIVNDDNENDKIDIYINSFKFMKKDQNIDSIVGIIQNTDDQNVLDKNLNLLFNNGIKTHMELWVSSIINNRRGSKCFPQKLLEFYKKNKSFCFYLTIFHQLEGNIYTVIKDYM
jgi:hypothetical protein